MVSNSVHGNVIFSVVLLIASNRRNCITQMIWIFWSSVSIKPYYSSDFHQQFFVSVYTLRIQRCRIWIIFCEFGNALGMVLMSNCFQSGDLIYLCFPFHQLWMNRKIQNNCWKSFTFILKLSAFCYFLFLLSPFNLKSILIIFWFRFRIDSFITQQQPAYFVRVIKTESFVSKNYRKLLFFTISLHLP